MHIAFWINPVSLVSGQSNGVLAQARNWHQGLQDQGWKVSFVQESQLPDWRSIDIVHLFGSGFWLKDIVPAIYTRTPNIVFSPIIDSNQSIWAYRLSSFLGCNPLRLYSHTFLLRQLQPYIGLVSVRSSYEQDFFIKALNYPRGKTSIHPVGVDLPSPEPVLPNEKENFCLHVSSIYQPRKNVVRLIKACKAIGLPLKLAGATGNDEQLRPILEAINGDPGIEVLGFVSRPELIQLYQRARVFALPSIMEGVGQVALEAALYHCEVVITQKGGPKDYFQQYAHYANPSDQEAIQQALQNSMNKPLQPNLYHHIRKHFGLEQVLPALINSYTRLLNTRPS